MKKTLKEIAAEKGKTLFIESYAHNIPIEDIEIFESVKIIESVDGTSYKARGVLKNISVSRYTENLNKRIYNKELWEKVCKKKMGEGSSALMGHPEDEGNPKDYAGVWHNLRVEEDTPKADLYLTGRNGQDILEHIEAGGRFGTSTVGFGELQEDGKTVDPESYELERIGDIVLTPSQQVFATNENLDIPEKQENVYKKENNSTSFNENVTNKYEKNNKEVDIMSNQIIEGTLKNQVKVGIKEALASTDFRKAIQDLKEFKKNTPVEMKETRSKIDEAVNQINEKMIQEENERLENLEKVSKENETLKEEMDTKTKALNEITERYRKVVSIMEKLGLEEEEVEKIETLNEELTVAKDNIDLMEKDLQQFETDTKYRDYDIKCLLEDRKAMEDDIVCFEEDKQAMKDDIEKFEKLVNALTENRNDILTHLRKLEQLIIEEGYEVEEYVEKEMDIDFPLTEEDKKEKDDEEDAKTPKDMVDDQAEVKEEKEKDKEDDKEPEKKDDEKEKEDDKEDDKEKDKDKEDEKTEKKEEKENDDEKKDVEDDKEDDEKDKEDEEEEKTEKKKESFIKKINPDVIDFYKKAVKENAKIKNIRADILKASSLKEAADMVKAYENKSEKDEVIKIDESVNKPARRKPSWMGNRL